MGIKAFIADKVNKNKTNANQSEWRKSARAAMGILDLDLLSPMWIDSSMASQMPQLCSFNGYHSNIIIQTFTWRKRFAVLIKIKHSAFNYFKPLETFMSWKTISSEFYHWSSSMPLIMQTLDKWNISE